MFIYPGMKIDDVCFADGSRRNLVLEKQIGHGSDSMVWLGYDASKKKVAIKFFDKEIRDEKVKKETECFCKCYPENRTDIVHGVIKNAHFSAQYIVMPYFVGEPLSEWVVDGYDAHTIFDRLRVASLAAEKVSLMHDRGILHCDIKPGNIIVSKGAKSGDYEVNFIDFGFATDVTNGVTNLCFGTPGFISEHLIEEYYAKKRCEYSQSTDYISLGWAIAEIILPGVLSKVRQEVRKYGVLKNDAYVKRYNLYLHRCLRHELNKNDNIYGSRTQSVDGKNIKKFNKLVREVVVRIINIIDLYENNFESCKGHLQKIFEKIGKINWIDFKANANLMRDSLSRIKTDLLQEHIEKNTKLEMLSELSRENRTLEVWRELLRRGLCEDVGDSILARELQGIIKTDERRYGFLLKNKLFSVGEDVRPKIQVGVV